MSCPSQSAVDSVMCVTTYYAFSKHVARMGEGKRTERFVVGKHEGMNDVEELVLDGKTILKRILNK
jgi:hypothetical protein